MDTNIENAQTEAFLNSIGSGDSADDLPALGTEPEQITIFDPLAAGAELANNSMVLELHIRTPGWSKSIDPTSIMEAPSADGERKVNPKRLRASKDIIDRKEIKGLHRFIGKMKRKIINQQCHQASKLMASGLYILPANEKVVNRTDELIQQLENGMAAYLDTLGTRYPQMQLDAQRDLGPQYDANDYPPFEVIRAAYSVESQYLSFNVPAALAQMNKQIFERAVEKSKAHRAEMATVIRDAMRAETLKMVSHFAERLGKDEEGKAKSFHTNTAQTLIEFLDTWEDRDITQDVDFAAIIRQGKALIAGVDPKQIKSNEALREALERGFRQITEKASAMIGVKERKLALTEDI